MGEISKKLNFPIKLQNYDFLKMLVGTLDQKISTKYFLSMSETCWKIVKNPRNSRIPWNLAIGTIL